MDTGIVTAYYRLKILCLFYWLPVQIFAKVITRVNELRGQLYQEHILEKQDRITNELRA